MTRKLSAKDIGIHAETPAACADLSDVRQAIDTVDQQIIFLLGMRLKYVLRAADFKANAAAIPAPERVAAMLSDRHAWAQDSGLSPDFVVPLYAQIIQWFIQQQTQFWNKREREVPNGRP